VELVQLGQIGIEHDLLAGGYVNAATNEFWWYREPRAGGDVSGMWELSVNDTPGGSVGRMAGRAAPLV